MNEFLFRSLFKLRFVAVVNMAVLLFSFLSLNDVQAQSVVIGSTTSSTSYFYGPYYRSSSSSSFDYSRYAYVYTATELNIPPGSIITEIAWYKSSGTITGNNTFNIWLENTTNTTLTTGSAWSTLVASATQVYNSTTQSFTAANNSYESFTLSPTFTYTGGSLQILTDHAMNGSATAANNYYYNSAPDMAIGYASSAAPSPATTLNTGSYGDNRPTIKITYMPGTPCSGQPTAGTVPATMNVCPNDPFTLTATGATFGSGMSNQWQSRNPANTGPWVDITGATNPSYTVSAGITTATDYRYITVCNSSSLSDTSTVMAVSINPPNMCYCTPTVSTSSSYYITSFSTTLGSINITNNNTSSSPGGYIDYSASDTVEATQGTSVDFSMTTSSGYVSRAIYVDWNQNGSFVDPGEEVYNSIYPTTPYTATTVTGTIPVPISALPGSTRMRVRSAYYYNTVIDPCSALSYGESEDYTFTVIQATPCASVTFPSSVDAEVDQDTLCLSGDISLSLSASMPVASGITYQWQSSPDGTTWTDIDTPQLIPDLDVSGVNSSTDYRCEILCSGSTVLTSTDVHVHVNNPQLSGTPQGGTRCGPGTVVLTATAPAGTAIKWYDAPTGGISLGNGSSFTTPYIASTTDFYVAAATDTAGGPVVRITEMNIGGPDGLEIQNLGSASVDVTGWRVAISDDYSNITTVNSIVQTLSGILNPGDILSWTDNSGPDYWGNNILWDPTGSGWAILLDENDNVIDFVSQDWPQATVQTTSLTIGSSTVSLATAWVGAGLVGSTVGSNSFQRTGSIDNDMASDFVSAAPTIGTTNSGLLMPFAGSGCEGPRQAVTATVTPGPAFALDYDSVVCNDAIRPLSVSSPLSNYSSYMWTPTTNLYTDAAGTIPYTGTSATTVYFKSDISGAYSYAVAATNGPLQTDCAAADTANFWVQPGSISIAARPDTICVTGATELTLVPDSNYYPSTIQWQESADGINYTNIAGANTETYTTPVLSTDHYYKALVSAQTGVCESPDKYILIANPELISANDSFNCGPGTVTLQATVGNYTTARWYPDTVTNQPLAMGSPFVTPFLSLTDTFYVSSGTGTPQPDPAYMGTGTSTYNYAYTPYYKGYQGSVCQWLIKASDLQSAGFAAGNIISIGFDVATVGDAVQDFSFSMGLTTLTTLPSTLQTGLTPVYSVSSYQPVSGDNVHVLDNAFYWDGTQNIVIQRCVQNTSTGTSTYVKYETSGMSSNYEYANAPAQCTTPTGYVYTTSARPNIQIGMEQGCESPREPVIAYIHPKPQVDLGEDINECVDSGAALVLNAGIQPHQPSFLWDDGSTSQIRSINQSGMYYVAVTNQYTCVGSDTVNVILRDFPQVELGNDTTVCEGVTVMLDAGDDGIQYFWNTGENSQEITVDESGSYAVLVTNAAGCTRADTVNVTMNGQLPTLDGIQVLNNGEDTFVFNALNAQNVAGYEWDFGDGSPHSFLQSPKHKYPADGNYLVTLKLSSTCGYIMDSTAAHIVGIHDLDLGRDELSIYPNPTKEKATILNKAADVRMEQVEVFTILGKKVYSQKADSPARHELSLSGFASGMYTIRIQTNKGNAARKLELIR